MHHVLTEGLAILRAHQAWAGPLLALGACFEALVVVGALAPLTPLLVLVGAGIGAGVFSPWVLVWTMAGCAVGNSISYEIGVRARGAEGRLKWIPAHARRSTDALFVRYGALAVLVGRFLGPTAAIVPFLAGWTAMPRGTFFAANVATSLVWPVAMAALGYVGIRPFLD